MGGGESAKIGHFEITLYGACAWEIESAKIGYFECPSANH